MLAKLGCGVIGNTADSGSAILGSSPGIPAKEPSPDARVFLYQNAFAGADAYVNTCVDGLRESYPFDHVIDLSLRRFLARDFGRAVSGISRGAVSGERFSVVCGRLVSRGGFLARGYGHVVPGISRGAVSSESSLAACGRLVSLGDSLARGSCRAGRGFSRWSGMVRCSVGSVVVSG